MSDFVVDASAIVALARGEKGFQQVNDVRDRSVVSVVNLTEAFSRLVRHKVPTEQVRAFLRHAYPHVAEFDREQAEETATLHAKTREYGLSYGDCACLTLGSRERATVLTGDRRWKEMGLDVKIKLFR